uniref:USP domain-containing protein n=1 Tax=Cyprinodon variegatus TaxID=28743 RepID=A0A3Q2DYB0_CYPVA
NKLFIEPISVPLDQPGSLTLAMCKLLNEIQESKKGVVTPRELFSQVCKKAARFKGFQQQDSQELLRYLLDGMRAEELKMAGNKSLKTDERLMFLTLFLQKVPSLFAGYDDAHYSLTFFQISVVTEMFLDLSLPVSDEVKEKKNPKKGNPKTSESSQDGRESPDLTKGNEDTSIGSGSKYQQKKAKKQAKKQAKHQKRQQKLETIKTLGNLTFPSDANGEPTDVTEHPKDAENVDDAPCDEASLNEQDPEPVCVSEQDEAVEQEKEEDKDSVTDSVSLADSPVSNRFNVLSEEQHSHDGASCNEMSNADLEGELDMQLANKLEQVNLDDAFIDPDAMEPAAESEDEAAEDMEYTVINQDPETAFDTLSTRTSPEKQECSVQSCLFQFTEVETLTQNNSLLCVTCTKQRRRKEKAGGTNVYTLY